MNDRKPRPMNSAEPHGSGLGALIVGHSAKRLMTDVTIAFRRICGTYPVSGRDRHALEPPAQLTKPDLPIKDAPMSRTTRPVICGGKTRLRILGGTKARPICQEASAVALSIAEVVDRTIKREHKALVPRR